LQVSPLTAHALAAAMVQLVDLFQDVDAWAMLQSNAMRQSVGWEASAAEYAGLYDHLTDSA